MVKIAIGVGDVVVHADQNWVVLFHDERVATFRLRNGDGTITEVPSSDVQFFSRPALQWPFVAAPVSRGAGSVTKITRTGIELVPIVDWVPSAFGRAGGSIFFSPLLKLRIGEVLVAHHEKGKLSRLNITPAFGTVATRRVRKAKNDRKPLTFNQRLLNDESIFKESE